MPIFMKHGEIHVNGFAERSEPAVVDDCEQAVLGPQDLEMAYESSSFQGRSAPEAEIDPVVDEAEA